VRRSLTMMWTAAREVRERPFIRVHPRGSAVSFVARRS
jgi:hypothetical protein